jgi:predicted nucleic acid-binding protein
MPSIPTGRRVFLDTNVLLYAVTEHPGYGKWADVLLDRIRNNRVEGVISVIVLNELLHQLVIGEVSQREELHPSQAIRHIKVHPDVLTDLAAYEVVEDVEKNYRLQVVGVDAETFAIARALMREHQLLSNDALHLAVMQIEGITDLVTNDRDFNRVVGIKVWRPASE